MAKDRGLVNRVPIGNAVDKQIWERIKKYSEESMIPISKILDKALELFLKSVEK